MTTPLLYPGQVAADHPDRVAVAMGASGESITFADLDAFASRLSRLLRAIGLERGDHIALCVENRLEFLPIIWGCHYAGLCYTPISRREAAEMLCSAGTTSTGPSRAEPIRINQDLPLCPLPSESKHRSTPATVPAPTSSRSRPPSSRRSASTAPSPPRQAAIPSSPDGRIAHPFCTEQYLKDVIVPRIQPALAARGRSLDDFERTDGHVSGKFVESGWT
ncbi:AMP-binding protein [Candidatus Poriferisodalis sp.]|uniref:AMP-binding protein n=1 Tax=Candidatus Poriferisodalis sp. TaxID=3101277 RepID=UPI003B016C7A